MDTDFEKCTVFRSNELSGAQNVLLPLLLSRFPLYLRKKAQDAAAIGAHIFNKIKNMSCIFEIRTIDKQNERAKFYRGEIHRLMILMI